MLLLSASRESYAFKSAQNMAMLWFQLLVALVTTKLAPFLGFVTNVLFPSCGRFTHKAVKVRATSDHSVFGGIVGIKYIDSTEV